ncbi:hypothetical protein JKP88DRAFT_249715 [Tribonema minus]|uniref:Ankyrin repeat domain containing protein n=1 Tax=Tribonema minus TaxID=303371 RepID=A0A835YS69_9STRA|nr:hypothetical protein JKP88DRAFT_249715 [Tribonema minus]
MECKSSTVGYISPDTRRWGCAARRACAAVPRRTYASDIIVIGVIVIGGGALQWSIWGHCLSYLGLGRLLHSTVSKDILAAYRTLFDQATTTISADLFATVPMAQLTFTGNNFLRCHWLSTKTTLTLARRSSGEVAIAAARGGRVHVLQWLHELVPFSTQTTHSLLKSAASSGQIDALDWIIAGHDWRGGGAAACAAAAAAGRFSALVHLRRHGSAWDHDAFEEAAAHGQTDMMDFLVSEDAPLSVDDAYRRAAQCGQRESLEWLEVAFDGETPWDENVFSCAAISGSVELLRCLHAERCPWDDHASCVAAIDGHIEMMDWLHTVNAPMALDACDVAYTFKQFEAFEWAYSHGLPVSGKLEVKLALEGDDERLEWLRVRGHWFHNPPDMWAAGDNIVKQWLHDHRFPYDTRAAIGVIGTDAVDWILYEVGSGAWDERSCIAAAFEGDMTALSLLHTTCRATGGGHDEEVCAAAAAGGHMDVLRWARGEKCAWDGRVCAEARVNGHLDVLRWAVSEGCPCGEAELRCLA